MPPLDGWPNRSGKLHLGTLLRVLVRKNLKVWDLLLAQAEFTYNGALSRPINESPFTTVYGHNPLGPLDLLPIHIEKMNLATSKRVKEIQELHKKVQEPIEKANERYQNQVNKHRKQAIFKPRDLVWIHLRKEQVPSKRKSKLLPWADGPFEVREKIIDNVYKIDLPEEYGVSCTFNVADLKPYYDDDKLENLRANSPQQGEDDAPLVYHDEDQSKSKDVEKILKLVENQLRALKDYFWILLSKSLAFFTLVT